MVKLKDMIFIIIIIFFFGGGGGWGGRLGVLFNVSKIDLFEKVAVILKLFLTLLD